jgi:hypothetical protein
VQVLGLHEQGDVLERAGDVQVAAVPPLGGQIGQALQLDRHDGGAPGHDLDRAALELELGAALDLEAVAPRGQGQLHRAGTDEVVAPERQRVGAAGLAGRVRLLAEGPAAEVGGFLEAVRARWGKQIENAATEQREALGQQQDFRVVR